MIPPVGPQPRNTVRDAHLADAGALAEIQVRSWRAAYRGLLPETVLAELSESAVRDVWDARLQHPPPRTATLVVTDAGDVVGFSGFGPPLDGDPGPTDGHLYTLYLLPDRWGRGLGRLLHDAAIARMGALGFTAATLWVLDGNDRAIDFYRRAGWQPGDGTRTDVGPGDVVLSELLMRRSIGP